MNKQRNFRNWLILVLIMTIGLVLVGLNSFNWPGNLLAVAMVALVSYWALGRLHVL